VTNSEVMGNERLIPYARGFDLTDRGKSRTSAVGADHGGADPLVDAEARWVEFPLVPFKRFTEEKDVFETRWRSRWAVNTGVMAGCYLKPI
jgi:hypothetical protein